MSEVDIKSYTSRAVELESAIYTQRKLMEEHQNIIRNQRPISPRSPNLQPPVKPSEPSVLVTWQILNAVPSGI